MDKHLKVHVCNDENDNDHKNKHSEIIEVRCGYDSELVAVVVRHEEHQMSIFIWDVKRDSETNMIQVGSSYNIIWDPKGNPVILDNKRVIMSEQQCLLKVFNLHSESL